MVQGLRTVGPRGSLHLRYYRVNNFDLDTPDEEGSCLANNEAACIAAAVLAGHHLGENPALVATGDGFCVKVLDKDRRLLFEVAVKGTRLG